MKTLVNQKKIRNIQWGFKVRVTLSAPWELSGARMMRAEATADIMAPRLPIEEATSSPLTVMEHALSWTSGWWLEWELVLELALAQRGLQTGAEQNRGVMESAGAAIAIAIALLQFCEESKVPSTEGDWGDWFSRLRVRCSRWNLCLRSSPHYRLSTHFSGLPRKAGS